MNNNDNSIFKNKDVDSNYSVDNEIIVYHPNSTFSLDVRVEKETVWLTQPQIAELFGTKRPAITKHLSNIFKSGELDENSVCSILEHTATDGKNYRTKFYNLDAILSVGYRVNSINATQFRQWANKVLKEYLLRGYSVNQRLLYMESRIDHRLSEHDRRLDELTDKIDFFVKASLPPVEGIFFNGQIFDAYKFVCDLVKSAKNRIVLIDNYVDESVLTLFDKREVGVESVIYTDADRSRQIRLDLQRHNRQYAPIEIKYVTDIHDRFLIIDDALYHIGASIKDLGKKLFAFSKMEIPPSVILDTL
ncbi:RhuM family protein [uncultured Duncaniella sp.]|uniref:RhuM family protein n=1 Tax=uncultured Duncaniella sp. TaxID=2768039 RepID=UPI002676EA3A|nr:RhuM family protein [uncultured Duncaniella sp.]MCI9172695.1 DNA-binding protein [Muribaculaceae bacterium]